MDHILGRRRDEGWAPRRFTSALIALAATFLSLFAMSIAQAAHSYSTIAYAHDIGRTYEQWVNSGTGRHSGSKASVLSSLLKAQTAVRDARSLTIRGEAEGGTSASFNLHGTSWSNSMASARWTYGTHISGSSPVYGWAYRIP